MPMLGEGPPVRHGKPDFQWVAGLVAAILAVAVVAGLVFTHRALTPAASPPSASSASSPSSVPTASVGSITSYAIPMIPSFVGPITSAADGKLWVIDVGGPNGSNSTLFEVTTSGTFLAHSVSGYLWNTTAGPDGNIWFTEGGVAQDVASSSPPNTVGKIGKINSAGIVTEYALPTAARPYGIASGPDGALWATDAGTNAIINVTTSGVLTEYPIPTVNSDPGTITAGPDGNLWFIERNAGKVARISTSGFITEFTLPDLSFEPVAITAGRDGNIWITERSLYGAGGPGKVAKISAAGIIGEFPVPNEILAGGAAPFEEPAPGQIAAAPDGGVWLTAGDDLDRVTTSGAFSQYFVPMSDGTGFLEGVAAGPDGNIWFTEHELDQHDYVGKLPISGG
jgi:virginiamycin B lyase